MSGFSALQDGTASAGPKQMSSRLSNMKFMQRATAVTTQKNPNTPSTPTERAPKRRRTADFTTTVANLNSPSTAPNTPSYTDRTPNSTAHPTPLNGIPTRTGTNNFSSAGEETEWVLDIRLPLPNGTASHEDESSSDEEDDIWAAHNSHGRQTYGSFNKKKQRTSTNTSNTNSSNTNTATGTTYKRPHPDSEDEDLSSLPSNSDFDETSEGEIPDTKPKRKDKFDFKSQADLKRMDAFNYQKASTANGLGRQRHGLGGAGGFASPGHGRGQGQSQGKQRKKARKTM